jgi:transposase
MTQRYELNARQWRLVEPLLPKQGRGGAWRNHRQVLHGILWAVGTGAPWRDMPRRYGPWQTAYDRFVRWRKDGTWQRLADAIIHALAQDDALDPRIAFIDATVVRASSAAAGGGKKGGQTSPRTTHWDAPAAASARSSTSSWMPEATSSL